MRFLFSFLLFNLCSLAFSQVDQDSLLQVWHNEQMPDSDRFQAVNAYYVAGTHSLPESSLALTRAHYSFARLRQVENEMTKALNERAFAFYVLGAIDSAMLMLHQALKIKKSQNDSAGIARMYANLGSMYRDQNQYQEAVRYYTQSLDILEQTQAELPYRADLHNNLGLLYEDINMYDLALTYLNQALSLYEQAGIQDKVGNIWLNMGALQLNQGNSGLALAHFQKAMDMLQASNNQFSIADCHYMFAELYRSLGQTDTAISHAQKSIAINQKLGNEKKWLTSRILYADLMLATQAQEAQRMGEQVLEAMDKFSDNSLKTATYKLLYKCYRKKGQYRQSLAMHEAYLTYYDSVLMGENRVAVVKAAIESEFEQKLLRSQMENEKAQAQLKLKQLQRIYALIFGGTLLVFIIFFYARNRINFHRKQRQALLAEIEKLKQAALPAVPLHTQAFQLNRSKIEATLDKKLNETDWKVLNILLADPVISNKEIAEQAFLSVDGIGSSLRRMYLAFDIKESKYKKISLLMEAMRRSNQ
jgi:tetratricopeptide (TPR) repeat protein